MRSDGSGATVLDRYYGNRIEGIAVDWIGRFVSAVILVITAYCTGTK